MNKVHALPVFMYIIYTVHNLLAQLSIEMQHTSIHLILFTEQYLTVSAPSVVLDVRDNIPLLPFHAQTAG